MKKYAGIISYDGSAYLGFQRQKEGGDIQSEIERALSFYLGEEIQIKAAGRTDRGVHALGQVISFNSPRDLEEDSFLRATLDLLPRDIYVQSLKEVPEDFDPRHSAALKVYRYRFVIKKHDPFRQRYRYEIPFDIDLGKLEAVLRDFLGTHNFLSFTGKEIDKDGYIRDIKAIRLFEDNGEYVIELEANGFMRYMVRMMVGSAFKVASGRLDPSFIKEHLDNPSHPPVPFSAPPEGLYLYKVIYDRKDQL